MHSVLYRRVENDTPVSGFESIAGFEVTATLARKGPFEAQYALGRLANARDHAFAEASTNLAALPNVERSAIRQAGIDGPRLRQRRLPAVVGARRSAQAIDERHWRAGEQHAAQDAHQARPAHRAHLA